MKCTLSVVAAFLAIALAATGAAASGAWTNWLKAYSYTDLLAETDTVWCATAEAGLLRYERVGGTFSRYAREPGGLANNSLSVLARDRSRRLWVGTTGSGVSRLLPDGSSWDLLNRFDGLPSDSITALTAVGDTVWIGTTGGLALWNGHIVAGALPDGVNPSPFANNWMTGIVEYGDSLWVTTQAGMYVSSISAELRIWDPAERSLPKGLNWAALVTDRVGLFAMTIGGTIVRRDFASGGWLVVSNSTIGKTWRLQQSGTNVISSSDKGIFVWNGSGWTQINSSQLSDGNDPTTFAAAIDPAGRGWAADQDGLYQQPASAGAWSLAAPPGPPGNFILNLEIEGSRLYVSTNTEGVGRFDGRQWRNWPPVGCTFCDTTFTIPFYSFGLIADRRGHKWFGMWQVAVEELDDTVDPPQVTHHYYSPPPLDLRTNSWAAARDSARGGVWFGMDTNCFGCTGRTPLGLLYYGRDGGDSLNLRQDSIPQMRGTKVHGLTVDRAGRIWVGYTGEGIQYFDWPIAPNTSFAFNNVENTGNFDVRALESRGDTVWAMTTRDVRIYYRPIAAFVDSFLLPSVPADLALRPLAIGPDGTVYVGTTVGMRVRKLNGSIEDFNVSNSPIAGNAVQAIRVDPATGVVWIGTGSGLSRYDPGYRPPPPPPAPKLSFTLYPNPSKMNALGISLTIAGIPGLWRGAIYDLNGRILHAFAGSGGGVAIWDGRDRDGNLVRPGIYFVHVESGGSSDTKRIAILR